MREIKFRAWDKRKNKMVTDFVIAPTSPTWGCFPIEQPCEKVIKSLKQHQDHMGDYTLVDWSNFYGLERDEFILMQFTGLHDRHSKDIYEGDIVKINKSITHKIDGIGTVYWSENGAYWGCKTSLPFLLHKASEIEVIGNIYENGDLLK